METWLLSKGPYSVFIQWNFSVDAVNQWSSNLRSWPTDTWSRIHESQPAWLEKREWNVAESRDQYCSLWLLFQPLACIRAPAMSPVERKRVSCCGQVWRALCDAPDHICKRPFGWLLPTNMLCLARTEIIFLKTKLSHLLTFKHLEIYVLIPISSSS